MIKNFISLFALTLLIQPVWADTAKPAEAQADERLTLIRTLNHAAFAYRAEVIPKMLAEANWAAHRLNLPTHYPIGMTDIQDDHISALWSSIPFTNGYPDTVFGTNIFDPGIPRDDRLRSFRIGLYGYIANANFEFGFVQGKLCRITRMSEPNVEYYAHDLDKLVGKPSLIDTNGAYQLATQWLAALDVDVVALNKLKWTVNQLHYLPHGTTNAVTLPLFYVDFGSIHSPADGNLKASDKPLVSVEILGTTKELQNLEIVNALLFSHRQPVLITNILELIRTPNPPMKHLEPTPMPGSS
ncbi:MAG TPA: hypothetical protein VGM66_13910 [Candidatus Udaeobacter sp.]|jgi:hypothetical protein